MSTHLRVIPLEEKVERKFFGFLDKDRVRHIFTIYDLKQAREKTKAWISLRDGQIAGYTFEFDKRIVHTHGEGESVPELLHFITLEEPVFVTEPHHLATVQMLFEPVEPTDPSSEGKITTYLVMKTCADIFKPIVRHGVKRLRAEDIDRASKSLGEEHAKRLDEAIHKGIAFGAYDNDQMASYATVTEIVDDLALIRGVYTAPSLRGQGLATSTCSALVAELIKLGKDAVLWVSKDNLPARKVYEKIGFRDTGIVLLAFKARIRSI